MKNVNQALTRDQILDLFNHVWHYGASWPSLGAPSIENATEYCAIFDGSPDSYSVLIVDGWPCVASDDLCMCHHVLGGLADHNLTL